MHQKEMKYFTRLPMRNINSNQDGNKQNGVIKYSAEMPLATGIEPIQLVCYPKIALLLLALAIHWILLLYIFLQVKVVNRQSHHPSIETILDDNDKDNQMTGVLILKSEESDHGPMDIASSSPDSTKRLVIFIQLFLLFLRATSTNRFNKSALVCAEFNWLTNFIFLGFVCYKYDVECVYYG